MRSQPNIPNDAYGSDIPRKVYGFIFILFSGEIIALSPVSSPLSTVVTILQGAFGLLVMRHSQVPNIQFIQCLAGKGEWLIFS